jgi:hypothetical protein
MSRRVEGGGTLKQQVTSTLRPHPRKRFEGKNTVIRSGTSVASEHQKPAHTGAQFTIKADA